MELRRVAACVPRRDHRQMPRHAQKANFGLFASPMRLDEL
jgi:hypothetical protein